MDCIIFSGSYPVATPRFIHPRNSDVSHWLMSPPVGNGNSTPTRSMLSTAPAPPPYVDSLSNNVRLMRPQDFVCKHTASDLIYEDDCVEVSAQKEELAPIELTPVCSDSGVGISTCDHNLFLNSTDLFSDDYFIEHIFSLSLLSTDLSDFRRRIKLLFPHKICCSVLSFMLRFAQTSIFSSDHQCFLTKVGTYCSYIMYVIYSLCMLITEKWYRLA